MPPKKTLLSLAGALVFSAAAFLLLHRAADDMERKARKVPVVISTDYIPARSRIRPDQVEVRRIPETYVNPGAVSDISQLGGLTSMVPISSGEQVLANKFSRSGGSLTAGLEPGNRAFCLAVPGPAGVGGWLRPGNHVDVLARFESRARRVTGCILQDVRVLAVGSSSGEWVPSPDASGGPDPYENVTLSVSPREAEMLAFLEETASIKLILRGEDDREKVVLPPVGETELMSRLGGMSEGPQPVRIIRGSASSPSGGAE